jgi:hypothetical protein
MQYKSCLPCVRGLYVLGSPLPCLAGHEHRTGSSEQDLLGARVKLPFSGG